MRLGASTLEPSQCGVESGPSCPYLFLYPKTESGEMIFVRYGRLLRFIYILILSDFTADTSFRMLYKLTIEMKISISETDVRRAFGKKGFRIKHMNNMHKACLPVEFVTLSVDNHVAAALIDAGGSV